MMRIHVTYEDIWWDENAEPDTEANRESGFVVGYNRYAQPEDATREFLRELYEETAIDLEDEIECRDCAAILSWDGNLWVDENNSISGVNPWMDYPFHIHWPEKTIHEIAADYLEMYGAYEDSGMSFYGEYETVDYYRGIDRQYAVHFEDGEWNDLDIIIILGVINLRHKQRQENYERMTRGQKKAG